MSTWMVLDLETENHVLAENVASPFHEQNYIVAPGWSYGTGPVQHRYFTSREEADASDWFQIPDDVQYLVAHNAQFELVWLLHRHRAELERFLRRGGRVLCTQLAEYLLSNQQDLYPTLDETAPKYGGTHKIDEVKILWERGWLTSQIDKALLLEYLTGPQGDIENTRRVIFGQVPLLQARGQWESFLVRCDQLLYSAYSQFFGMHLNPEQVEADKAMLTGRIAELEKVLAASLPEDADVREQFNYGSDFHMSAFIFGGPMKLKVKVPYDEPTWEKADFYHLKDTEERIPATPEGEQHIEAHGLQVVVYASGKNKGCPKVFREDTDVPKLKWGERIFQFPGLINLQTLPHEAAVEYQKGGEFVGKRWLCDRKVGVNEAGKEVILCEGTPVYSTSGDSLELLKTHTKNEVLDVIVDLADAQKIYGTYYLGLFTKNLMPDGMVRAGTNLVSTSTGRLSSKLQQTPRVEQTGVDDAGNKVFTVGSCVKGALDSRFPDGRVIEVDYTALEVVHLCTLSGDKALLAALQAGTDMHILRLSSKWQRPYEELFAIAQDKNHPEHPAVKLARQEIKPQAFQFQYGGTAAGIAYKCGGTVEEAQAFIDNEVRLFPESSQFRDREYDEAYSHIEEAPIQREQDDAGRWHVYRVSYTVGPSGTRYSFRQYSKVKWIAGKKQVVTDFKIPQLANYKNQGEASLVTQTACGLVIRWLVENSFYDDQVLPINTVHDALYLDAGAEHWRMAALHVKALMEYAPKYMAALFPKYAALGIQDIPYPAVPEAGPNLRNKDHVH